MKRMWKRVLLIATLLVGSFQAGAALQIEITGGINEGQRIAVFPFENTQIVGMDVTAVVSADLMRSGQFAPLNTSQLPLKAVNGDTLNADLVASTGAQAAVYGKVYPEGSNYQIEYRIVSLQGNDKGKVLAHFKGAAPIKLMRQAAHRVSDRIYETLTGQKGCFRTRIAYIAYRHGERFPYQLMTADYDGFNETPILKSTQPLMTPCWSPDGRRVVYVSFEGRKPAIFVQDVYTKQRMRLPTYSGLNSSPAWSPDGNKIAMTLSKDGQPDIYYYDLVQKRLVRVTDNSAIDTEPAWSADSRSIFFTSERGGRAQIYRYDFATQKTERVTFQGKMNLSARAIPGSNSIIVITQQNGYRVSRMDADGSIYLLSTSSLDESPSVAPNGSMIIYSTVYQGRKGLALVSTDGRFKANLPSSHGEISAPAWGPILE